MRSDVRALMRIFAASFVLVLVMFGVLAAGALKALPINTAVGAAAVLFLVGVVVITRAFGPALTGRDRKHAGRDPGAAAEDD